MDLRDAIQRIALEWPSYGRPRITAALRRQGWIVNPKRVYRLLREDNLLCVRTVCAEAEVPGDDRFQPRPAGLSEFGGPDGAHQHQPALSGLDDPKTPRSDSYVYLPSGVQALLQEWRAWRGDSRPEAFIFPSKRDTRYDNYLKRVLKPAQEVVGLEGITHQMLRRSFSTMALDSGASPKDVQGQMRHTDARMSLYYGRVIPASVKQEVNKPVDQMKTKIEKQDKEYEQTEAKTWRKR